MLFVPQNPLLYSKLSMEIKKDRELAKTVLSNSNGHSLPLPKVFGTRGWMLDSMPQELKRDKEVVLMAARSVESSPAFVASQERGPPVGKLESSEPHVGSEPTKVVPRMCGQSFVSGQGGGDGMWRP